MKCIALMFVGFLVISISLLFIQVESTTVPEWKILVVKDNGEPASGKILIQEWRNYSLEEIDNTEKRITDKNGFVVFPIRTISASIFARIIGPPKKFLELFIEAGYGPHAWVVCASKGYGGSLDYIHGKPPPSLMVLKRKVEP
jgi:hypothetical protein